MKPAFPAAVLTIVALTASAQTPSPGGTAGTFPVAIAVDAGRDLGELAPIWRFFGADEPNYATMKDGRKLLGEIGELGPDRVYFRAHNLLCTGDGTPALKWGSTNVYTEDAEGRPVYDWTVVDRIFDAYRARHVRPYVEIGFMPQALSTHPSPYQHEWRPGAGYGRIGTGWSYPPTSLSKWAELIYRWVRHCVERYGRAEVERWYWEVWNEPNLEPYWHGTPEQFLALHDHAIDAVRRALPTARVGGPDVAGTGGRFMDAFLAHVTDGRNHATGRRGTPTDFLSFHAKGSPEFVAGHVRLGIAAQLATIDAGFAKISAIPSLRALPIVIGESDPDGCAACQGPQLGYRNTTMYSSYTAAAFARKHLLAARHGVNLEGALTWAFEFEDQPFFAGQRALANNGIDLPVMNVFRLFARMGGRRVATTSSGEVPLEAILRDGVRATPDVAALAGLEGRRLALLVWHYHDEDVAGPDASVTLDVHRLPVAAATARLTEWRIDATHSNAHAAWVGMGSPTAPTDAQYAELVAAGQLTALPGPDATSIRNGNIHLVFSLPRQAVSLFVLEW